MSTTSRSDYRPIYIYIDDNDPLGGWVCNICGWPVESEPCPDHAPEETNE